MASASEFVLTFASSRGYPCSRDTFTWVSSDNEGDCLINALMERGKIVNRDSYFKNVAIFRSHESLSFLYEHLIRGLQVLGTQ